MPFDFDLNFFNAAYGADPGSRGCQAIITKNRELYFQRFEKVKRLREIKDWICDMSTVYILIGLREYVHSIRGKDKDIKRLFAFGENNGKLQMAIDCADFPCYCVTPGDWQRALKVAGRWSVLGSRPDQENTAKMQAYQRRAIELQFTNKHPNITQDAAAGILIAECQWQRMWG